MPLDPSVIVGRRLSPETVGYTRRDTMLYALSLGYGADPMDMDELRFVYEDGLVALPTMACVIGHRSIKDMDLDIDYTKIVHGEQSLTLYRPLPSEGEVVCETVIEDVIDRGAGKGALLTLCRSLCSKFDGTLLAETRIGALCRGDGGFGGAVRAVSPAPLPDRDPDVAVEQRTLPQAALLYRLNGDLNPLHGDPRVAKRAGFDRPILHGLATFGMAARAIIASLCGNDPEKLGSISGRFSAPVFPGETLRTEIWRSGAIAFFRTRVVERDVVVLNNGRVDLRDK